MAGSADVGDQGGVAALEEEPGALEGPLGQLELGQLGLVVAEVRRQVIDVAAQGAPLGVVGAGLGRIRRLGPPGAVLDAVRDRVSRGARSPRVELVAQRLPLAKGFEVRLAVALADALQRVRAVADRCLGLRVEAVEAAVANIGPGA